MVVLAEFAINRRAAVAAVSREIWTSPALGSGTRTSSYCSKSFDPPDLWLRTAFIRSTLLFLSQHLPVNFCSEIIQEIAHAYFTPPGLYSSPQQQPPHGEESHSMAANGQCRSAPAVCVGYSAQGFAGLPIPFFGIVTHRFAEVRGVFQIIFQCQKAVFAHGTRHRELAFNVTSNYFDDFRLGQKGPPCFLGA